MLAALAWKGLLSKKLHKGCGDERERIPVRRYIKDRNASAIWAILNAKTQSLFAYRVSWNLILKEVGTEDAMDQAADTECKELWFGETRISREF